VSKASSVRNPGPPGPLDRFLRLAAATPPRQNLSSERNPGLAWATPNSHEGTELSRALSYQKNHGLISDAA
jgi:hypothetical protein